MPRGYDFFTPPHVELGTGEFTGFAIPIARPDLPGMFCVYTRSMLSGHVPKLNW